MIFRISLALACVCAFVTAQEKDCGRVRKRTAEYWENKWDFVTLPFGGQWVEIFATNSTTSDLPPLFPEGVRGHGNTGYCIMKDGDPSQFRRILADDIWHWYYGHSILVYSIDPKTGLLTVVEMGMQSGTFIYVVKAGDYLAARIKKPGKNKYALMGVSGMPAYTMDDIEVPKREKLLSLFPQHTDVIIELTAAS